MALNSFFCADVSLRNYSPTHCCNSLEEQLSDKERDITVTVEELGEGLVTWMIHLRGKINYDVFEMWPLHII